MFFDNETELTDLELNFDHEGDSVNSDNEPSNFLSYHHLEKLKRELRNQSPRPTTPIYKILGVPKNATVYEITRTHQSKAEALTNLKETLQEEVDKLNPKRNEVNQDPVLIKLLECISEINHSLLDIEKAYNRLMKIGEKTAFFSYFHPYQEENGST